MRKKVKETMKIFSCLKCGTPFEVYPPDDLHNIATRKETDFIDNIKIDYKCKVCGDLNTIFWGHSKPIAFVGS